MQVLLEYLPKTGYKLETYKVTTSDGYIITLLRLFVPGRKDDSLLPVYLQHGLGSVGLGYFLNG